MVAFTGSASGAAAVESASSDGQLLSSSFSSGLVFSTSGSAFGARAGVGIGRMLEGEPILGLGGLAAAEDSTSASALTTAWPAPGGLGAAGGQQQVLMGQRAIAVELAETWVQP